MSVIHHFILIMVKWNFSPKFVMILHQTMRIIVIFTKIIAIFQNIYFMDQKIVPSRKSSFNNFLRGIFPFRTHTRISIDSFVEFSADFCENHLHFFLYRHHIDQWDFMYFVFVDNSNYIAVCDTYTVQLYPCTLLTTCTA